MKVLIGTILSLLAIVVVGIQPRSGVSAQSGEWTTLFDGSSLDGWNVLGNANWELADGAVQADSGIFIRCADGQSVRDTSAYEVNIYDTRPDQTYRTGGIVHLAEPTSVIMTGGRWNTYEIVARGPRLQVTLNGTQTVDVSDSQYAEGPIALQYGAGVVKFRNVRMRRL
jgi:hypothetical protein